MKTTVRLPGAKQELDVRVCVTLEPEELPWPLRFYFLRTDADQWVNVGFEMGAGMLGRDVVGRDEDELRITTSAALWTLENFLVYQATAALSLDTRRSLPRPSGRPSKEELAYLARQYRDFGGQRGTVNLLAELHGVSRTTIWRRLKRAGVKV
jgi:hypothetical protein